MTVGNGKVSYRFHFCLIHHLYSHGINCNFTILYSVFKLANLNNLLNHTDSHCLTWFRLLNFIKIKST